MDAQDKNFMTKFLLVLGILVIFTVVVFLLARLLSTINTNKLETSDAYQKQRLAQISERLKKVGTVETFDPSATPKVRSGKEIFSKVCTTCHTPGVLNAPKVSDASAWQPRLDAAGSVAGLAASAAKGKGSMPPKGGDATLTDDELKSAITFMLKKAGVKLPESANSGASKPVTTTAKHAEPKPAPSATTTHAESTPAPSATNATTQSVTVSAQAAGSGSAATASAAAPAAKAAASAPAAPQATAEGEKIVKTVCFACHGTGVANAPKIGDKAAWGPRIATGMDSLYHSALHGKGAMPPKGGRLDLSDDQIKAAVNYLVSQAK